jgi:hypothetical protein
MDYRNNPESSVQRTPHSLPAIGARARAAESLLHITYNHYRDFCSSDNCHRSGTPAALIPMRAGVCTQRSRLVPGERGKSSRCDGEPRLFSDLIRQVPSSVYTCWLQKSMANGLCGVYIIRGTAMEDTRNSIGGPRRLQRHHLIVSKIWCKSSHRWLVFGSYHGQDLAAPLLLGAAKPSRP